MDAVDKKVEKKKKMLLRLPNKIYEESKKRADLKYITVTKYILQALIEKIAVEQQFD